MHPTLIVVDDILSNPEQVREAVLKQEFRDDVGPDGFPYKNIGTDFVPDLSAQLASLYDRPAIDIKLSFCRMDPADSETHSFCHADRICATHASVLYLNPPDQCKGGTAFWKHRPTGLDAMPGDEAVKMLGMEVKRFHQTMTNETKAKDMWDMAGFVGMKFNRLITYPTQMFHSRYPHESFGKSKDSSRLVHVCFFNLL